MVFLSRFSEVDAAILQQKAYKYLKYDTPARELQSIHQQSATKHRLSAEYCTTAPQLGILQARQQQDRC
jgi:hypothetical protein